MDISSEMIYPLIPLFLNDVLHASKTSIGVIEGIAESTASILKVFSGWLSDKLGKRKAIIFWGYGISVFSRPLLAGAASWFHVLVYRFTDRVGKGVRTAPRDAIIADSARPEILGKAFGFHRSMDTIGAVIGPTLLRPSCILSQQYQGRLLDLDHTGALCTPHHCLSRRRCKGSRRR